MNSESSHNEVNLARLLRRLEKAVNSQDWSYQSLAESSATWIRAEGMLQSVSYARKLLSVIKNDEDRPISSPTSSSDYLQATENKIDALESVLNDVRSRAVPKRSKLPSYLSHVPPPRPKPVLQTSVTITLEEVKSPEEITSQALLPIEEPELEPKSPVSDLLPSTPLPHLATKFTGPGTSDSPSDSLLPPRSRHSAAASPTTTDLPAFMHTSLQTQEDLSEQLAQMAAQLKRNAQTFAAQLHEDNALVQVAHDQLEGVHSRVKTEGGTLRAFRGKSGYTTCMTIGILLIVIISWVMMFFMIKVT
ncbi:membrane fusion protein Use1 [Rhizoctonia solani 123E]|uniref:Membrane fusion protein Use1 n=1 Tax=Rhizoctonia solani 123E TaxID=1423351 RepID=A0A074S5Q3_9AGAM|nr:membrane fusion protein Use1 [Rhizoctonia solani 123E]